MIDEKTIKLFNKIDTVVGHCEECGEETILVAIVQTFTDAQAVELIQNSTSMVEFVICN